MDIKEKIDYIRLVNTETVGAVSFFKLLSKFKTCGRVLEFLKEEKNITAPPVEFAECELEIADKKGVKIIFATDENYPISLKNINDKPPLLYVKGNIKALQGLNNIAIVGTRHPTINTKNLTFEIAKNLVNFGYTIVSGMAIGTDTFAHNGALASDNKKGDKTIAVLSGAVDNIYPEVNTKLYHKIIENGAVISDMPFGTKPQANLFPRRNRIISGLSIASVVVEAGIKSGSLITAKYALMQNRQVMAVPTFPNTHEQSGTNLLIKNGAKLIENADDIIKILDTIAKCDLQQGKENISFDLFENINEIAIKTPQSVNIKKPNSLDEIILSLLNDTPVSENSLIRQIMENHKYKQAEIANAILNLELSDKIAYTATGNIYKIKN